MTYTELSRTILKLPEGTSAEQIKPFFILFLELDSDKSSIIDRYRLLETLASTLAGSYQSLDREVAHKVEIWLSDFPLASYEYYELSLIICYYLELPEKYFEILNSKHFIENYPELREEFIKDRGENL